MSHDPTNVCVNHKNVRRQASDEVSLDQRPVVGDPRTHSETGNEAKLRRYGFMRHYEGDFSAYFSPFGDLVNQFRSGLKCRRARGTWAISDSKKCVEPKLLKFMTMASTEAACH
jgi:hypothetical protein